MSWIIFGLGLQFFFFFFFFEKEVLVAYYLFKGKSNKTKEVISGGTNSIQICKGKDNPALWAKECTTALPCRQT